MPFPPQALYYQGQNPGSALWGPLNKLRRARWQSDFHGVSPSRWFPAPLAMTNGPSFAAVERSSGDQKATKGDLKCVSLELLAERRFIGILTFGLCVWLRWKEVKHNWGVQSFWKFKAMTPLTKLRAPPPLRAAFPAFPLYLKAVWLDVVKTVWKKQWYHQK